MIYKLLSCVVLLLAIACVDVDAGIFTSITMENGDTDPPNSRESPGFGTVERTDIWFVSTSITCSGPGTMSCPKGIVNPGRGSDPHSNTEEAAVSYSWNQISLNNNSGGTTFQLSGYQLVKNLSWSYNQSGNRVSGYIKCWEIGQPMP